MEKVEKEGARKTNKNLEEKTTEHNHKYANEEGRIESLPHEHQQNMFAFL